MMLFVKPKPSANRVWRERNPEKVRAHWTVQNALRADKLRKGPCESCGSLKVHAHHEDYAKPLEVRWLCAKCHKRVHHPDGPKPRKWRNDYTPKPRESWVYPPKRDALLPKAQELRAKGYSYKRIAQELSLTKGTVYKWLNEVPYN